MSKAHMMHDVIRMSERTHSLNFDLKGVPSVSIVRDYYHQNEQYGGDIKRLRTKYNSQRDEATRARRVRDEERAKRIRAEQDNRTLVRYLIVFAIISGISWGALLSMI